jgi:enoyl-CoA hydratase
VTVIGSDRPVVAEPAPNDPRILVITLNRPEARNAVNGELAHALAEALDGLDSDDGLRVGILTGAGKGFSAGMDPKAFLNGDAPVVEGRGFAGFAEAPPRKPLIAAVEGFAVAGGLEIALACDLIVAARDAKLGLPEVKRSLVAAGGGLLRLAQLDPVPRGRRDRPDWRARTRKAAVRRRAPEPCRRARADTPCSA